MIARNKKNTDLLIKGIHSALSLLEAEAIKQDLLVLAYGIRYAQISLKWQRLRLQDYQIENYYTMYEVMDKCFYELHRENF